jgi:uncharacterized protein YjbI with pentapeptide repeats
MRTPQSHLLPHQIIKPDLPELSNLITAINEEVATSRTVLTGILALTIATIAAIVATSDSAIFYDSIELFPLFGVKIRLSAAYTLTPLIFVFLHANALLHLRLLIVRLHGLENRMSQLRVSDTHKVIWRRLVRGLPFAQLHAGPDTLPPGGVAVKVYDLLLKIVSTIAIAVMPVFLLLALQVSFVRYQNSYITYLHMVCLTVDIAILFWFGVITAKYPSVWWKSALSWSPAIASTAFVLWISYFVAVPPGADQESNAIWGLARPCCTGLQPAEWHPSGAIQNQASSNRPYSKDLDLLCRITNIRQTCRYLDLRRTVLTSETAQKASLFTGTQSEGSQSIVTKMASVAAPYRNLRFAQFDDSILLAADLRGIDGRKASFVGATMRNASLEGADIRWANFKGATLDEATLSGALVGDASFENASLISANFQGATLIGALLTNTNSTGASFAQSFMFLSSFKKSNLMGATFEGGEVNASLLDQVDLRLANPPFICFATKIGLRNESVSPAAGREALSAILATAGISNANQTKIKTRTAEDRDFTCKRNPLVEPSDVEADNLLGAVGLFICETHSEEIDLEVERFVRNVTASISWSIKVKEESWTSEKFGSGGPVRPPFQDHEIEVLEEITHNDLCTMVAIADEILSVNDDNCDNSVGRVDGSLKLRAALLDARDKASSLAACSSTP